jgi:hypothetical protein
VGRRNSDSGPPFLQGVGVGIGIDDLARDRDGADVEVDLGDVDEDLSRPGG